MAFDKITELPEAIEAQEAADLIAQILSAAERGPLQIHEVAEAIESIYYKQDPWTLLPEDILRRLEDWIIQAWKEAPYEGQRALMRLITPLDMPEARKLLETERVVADPSDRERIELILETPREAAYQWLWMHLKRLHDDLKGLSQKPDTHPFLPYIMQTIAEMRDSFNYAPAPPPKWQRCWYPSLTVRSNTVRRLERLVKHDQDFSESQLGKRILAACRFYLTIPDAPQLDEAWL